MKTYELKNYAHLKDLEADIVSDLNIELADLEITSDIYTECEVLEISKFTDFNGRGDVIIEVSCKGGIHSFCLRGALDAGRLILPEDKKLIVDEVFKQYDAIKLEYDEIRKAEEAQLMEQYRKEEEIRQKKIEAYKLKKAEEEAEKKFQARLTKSTEKFEHDIKTRIAVDTDIVEWLNNNLVSITATVPTHLENAFVKIFGDQPHKTVDSRRKTSGGYSMKFGPSFTLTIKKDATTIPVELADKIKDNKINNTAYISNLVRAYGFKFGKAA